MKRSKKWQPWQLDPKSVKTDRVQLWTESGTMAGLITLDSARELVATGSAIVCTSQAIAQISR